MNISQRQVVKEMRLKNHLSGMALSASILIILASGCASSSMTPSSSKAQPSVLSIEQPAMTDYMRSQIGRPNELSPFAPAEARNVRKIGNQWLCDLNGQAMVFNDAGARWEPKH